jgi:hypothetical protein
MENSAAIRTGTLKGLNQLLQLEQWEMAVVRIERVQRFNQLLVF